MISNISKAAKLSKIDTNHCVREARHIVTISGHQNEQSVRNYARDTSTAQKREILSISAFTEQSNVNNSCTSTLNPKNNENDSFDNEISKYDRVMSAAQYDSLIESIAHGEVEL